MSTLFTYIPDLFHKNTRLPLEMNIITKNASASNAHRFPACVNDCRV